MFLFPSSPYGVRSLLLFLFTTVSLGGLVSLNAAKVRAEDQPVKLTAEEQQAINSITKVNLQAAVSFLASDEMKGRMTPSPELAIASRYVATQLKAAGLKPLADDGSFFQVHTWPQVQLPVVQTVKVNDEEVPVLGLLSATAEEVKLNGRLLTESEAQKASKSEEQVCVVLDNLTLPPVGQASPAMIQSFLSRRVRNLTANGAAVIVVRCEADSVLPELARSFQGKPIRTTRGPECPVILVKAEDVAAGSKLEATIPSVLPDDASVRNVFGLIEGSDSDLKQSAIIVTAHLDHIGTRSFGPDRINNGADDNATGVAAVIAMAQAVARLKTPPKRSIIFGTFWGEEAGLQGSKAYAADPLWPLDETFANVNFEMLGRPEKDAVGKVWMTGWKHSKLGEVMNTGSQRVGVEVFNRTDVGEILYSRSDNYSFVQKGVVAHSFSAGSLHSDYHQPTDEWEKLNFDHMTTVTRGLMAGLLHLANTEEPLK